MLKISSIKILDYYKILCVFNTGEIRILDIQQSLDKTNNLVQKLTNHEVFNTAKIGQFGEIYWEEIGEIQKLDGTISKCNYDISPEFVLYNSSKV
jgi:hypothetical protein